MTSLDDILKPYNILPSKLMVPRLPDTIERDRLNYLFDNIIDTKVVVVSAGAGFGKSTLVAQAVKGLDVDTVWYQLDRSDSDLLAFLNYIIAGIRHYFPQFGNETFIRMAEARNVSREQDAIFTIFLYELEKTVTSDLVLVLDDYHLIQNSEDINKALTFFLHHFPDFIHLIFISRLGVNLPLSRLRSKRAVIDISERDLTFSPDEISLLYLTLFNIELDEPHIETLYTKTNGWIACLILFYHSLKSCKTPEIEKRLRILKGSQKIFFNYLQENVFEMFSEDKKAFLLKTSILSPLSVESCDHLLDIDHSDVLLKELEENHQFTFSLDEEGIRYQYHQLLRDFLQARLKVNCRKSEIQKLHYKAAQSYENNDEIEPALEHYLAANRISSVCRLFGQIGNVLAQKGRLTFIESFLSKVSDNDLNNESWLQYMHAQSFALSGKAHDAIRQFHKTLNFFRAQQSKKGEILCLSELGRNYFNIGNLKKAEELLRELSSHPSTTPEVKIEALSQLIFISSYLGKMEISDHYYYDVLKRLPEDEISREINFSLLYLCQGFRYHFSGDLEKAIELAEQAKPTIEAYGIYRLSVLYFQLIASVYYYMGRFSEGLTCAKEGLKIAEERGFQDSQAWLLLLCATNTAHLGKGEPAVKYAKACRRSFQALSNLHGQAGADLALIDAYIAFGDLSAAYETIKEGLKTIDGMNLPMIEGELIVRKAELLIRRKEYKPVYSLLDKAMGMLSEFKWYQQWVLCFFARYYWETGEKESAVLKLTDCLEICEKNKFDYWIVSEKSWIIPLLIEIAAHGHSQIYIENLIKQMGPNVVEELIASKRGNINASKKIADKLLKEISPATLTEMRICLLGKFNVFMGGIKIPDERWKSNKAKMLFKYLICFRSKGFVGKERLMELLWPEGDPEKTVNRFHVAMNALRKTLEPDLKRGKSSSFILVCSDSYQLVLGPGGYLDTEIFSENLSIAKRENNPDISIGYYLEAETLYKGDFLEEDPYDEWCMDEREQLKKEYLSAVTRIIHYYKTKKDYEKCIQYADKYLLKDRYDEAVYHQLIRFYTDTGNKSMAVRTFEKCKKNIQDDLNCPLSDEILATYEQLMSN